MLKINLISSAEYDVVLIIRARSNRSIGIPCGDLYFVPRIRVIPRFEAMTTMGARSVSRARLRKEKHSMSSMCTCSFATAR